MNIVIDCGPVDPLIEAAGGSAWVICKQLSPKDDLITRYVRFLYKAGRQIKKIPDFNNEWRCGFDVWTPEVMPGIGLCTTPMIRVYAQKEAQE